MSSSLRVMPMYRAASRSFVILGCEREPVLLLIIYCFSLIFIGLLFVVLHWCLDGSLGIVLNVFFYSFWLFL